MKKAVRKRSAEPPLVKKIPWFLLLPFFLSGATSLVLEVAWSKVLSYLLGVDLYASATVVTAYMAGIGLGAYLSVRLPHPWRHSPLTYALLQGIIGLFGVMSVPLFHGTQPLLSVLHGLSFERASLFLFLRFLIVFGLMLVPATLMGMTLPILAGVGHDRSRGGFARWTGLLYGVNTVGAVAGTLSAGFGLIPWLGLDSTCRFAGLADIGIGVAVLWYGRGLLGELRSPKSSVGPTKLKVGLVQSRAWPPVAIGLPFLLSGMAALVFEMDWFRLLSQIIGPSVHAFAVTLGVYLLGIGLGSLLGASAVRYVSDARAALGLGMACVALIALGTRLYLNTLPLMYGRLFLWLSSDTFTMWNLLIQGAVAALAIMPVTLGLGFLFPLATHACSTEGFSGEGTEDAPVGGLLFLNTLGGGVGCLLAGFGLLPRLGVSGTLAFTAGMLLCAATVLVMTARHWHPPRRWGVAVAGVVVGAMLMFLAPPADQAALTAGVYAEMLNRDKFKQLLARGDGEVFGGDLIFLQEGINNVVTVVANRYGEGELTLHLSGQWEASTDLLNRVHLNMLGHLPMLFARQAKSAAVIGLGSGITTGSMLCHPTLQRLDLMEIEPAVVAAAKLYDFINHRPLEDPRTRLILMDGRSELTYGNRTYDVISVDPIHPLVSGSGNLYSEDFYRIVRSRLNPGGIFCQWMPLTLSQKAFDTILATQRNVFPHLALFTFFGEGVVLASVEPLRIPWTELAARFSAPRVRADFASLDILTPFNVVGFLAGADRQIDVYLGSLDRRNTDDNVWLEHRIAADIFDSGPRKIPWPLPGSHAALADLLPGIPMGTLDRELESLARPTEQHFQRAMTARANGDTASLVVELEAVLEDVASPLYYEAGMALAYHLEEAGRQSEALSILSDLQKRFPAFPEPYRFEGMLLQRAGQGEAARNALRRGITYCPRDPRLHDLLSQLQARG
jgi:predicted membrane-bound spermidine synthase